MSMCMIVADGESKRGEGIELLQVIESLAYHKSNEKVAILFDFMVKNNRDCASSLLLVHRGLARMCVAKGNLLHDGVMRAQPLSGREMVSREQVLCELYRDHITAQNGSHERRMGFRKRRDCYRLDDEFHWVDVAAPGNVSARTCIEENETVGFPPFSAFETSGLPAHATSWFRVELDIEGLTYDYLVKRHLHFWVDGPDRVLKQIVEEDLPLRGYLRPGANDFLRTRVHGQILRPLAYDVVIFRPGVPEVDVDTVCAPVTGDVYSATIENTLLDNRVHFYVTRSPEFWIDVAYAMGL
ncbi:MAG: hypothetical protein JXB13_19825 [Phycisphaerae bacterium]|nr:hypothetical protein [Phycisphaerae bacterium]